VRVRIGWKGRLVPCWACTGTLPAAVGVWFEAVAGAGPLAAEPAALCALGAVSTATGVAAGVAAGAGVAPGAGVVVVPCAALAGVAGVARFLGVPSLGVLEA
jgi:hypothetical protein